MDSLEKVQKNLKMTYTIYTGDISPENSKVSIGVGTKRQVTNGQDNVSKPDGLGLIDGSKLSDSSASVRSINQEFERYSAYRLESILSPFAEKASKAEEFNEKSYMKALEIFNGKGEREHSLTEDLVYDENPSYHMGELIRDIAYVIDNFPENSPYFDKAFFKEMLIPPLDFRDDPSLQDFKALSCYVAGRFILSINGREPLSCPKDLRDNFFMVISAKMGRPTLDPAIRGILRELLIQGVMHCEMPALRRVKEMRSLFRERVLVPQPSDQVKKTILSAFAVVGEGYRPIFEDKDVVEYARLVLINSLTGIRNSEMLMTHWNVLVNGLIKQIELDEVDKDTIQDIGESVQRLLSDGEYPEYVQKTLRILDQLCKV